MSARRLVVVDVETSGLDPARHQVVEVSWWNLQTNERGYFVPPHNVHDVLANATIEALRINRYIDRLADAEQDRTGMRGLELADQLHDNVLAGSNPTFDASFLLSMFRDYERREWTGMPIWHHRLLDLSAYAAGVLHLPPTDLPGLGDVCALLGIENKAPHTAEGDVDATGRCFLALMETG